MSDGSRKRSPTPKAMVETVAASAAPTPALGLSAAWPTSGGAGVELMALARLLAVLDATPRMAAAAEALGLSYRSAWGRLVDAERALGVTLVERVKGHGSRLTPRGRELLAAVRRFEGAAGASLHEPLARLGAAVAGLTAVSAPLALRLAASHDLLLQRCIAEREAIGLTLHFTGSEIALDALANGACELAGFHRPVAAGSQAAVRPRIAGAGFVVPLARRDQGLIVAKGNPLRIREVVDLARPGIRFVNRQRGAATRDWLDRLLRDARIDAQRIVGYEIEEASHLSVAASVAAGDADAGFGLRAAALRFGLDFVPIGTETYWLAGLDGLDREPRVRSLIAAVRRFAAETPGYGPAVQPRRKKPSRQATD